MRLRLNSFINDREECFLKKIQGKKIICYGAFSIYERVNRIIYIEDMVEFFVDRNSERWGEIYFGKEIKEPESIKVLNWNKYAVVVLDRAFHEVSCVLDGMGLKEGVQYFNLYEMTYVRELKKHVNISNKLLNFLDSIPSEMRMVLPDKESKRIGIVMSIEGLNFEPDYPYCIALYLILKWKKYNVRLIVDNLHWTGDIELYDGFGDDCIKIQNDIIRKLEHFVPKSDILFIDTYGCNENSFEDNEQCEKIAKYSAEWQKWKNIQKPCYIPLDLLQKKYSQVFKKNIGYVDAFFEHQDFHTVNVSTAIHKRAGIIHYVCKKRGIKVSSQDGFKGVMGLGADGISAYGGDVAQVIQDGWISLEEEKNILERAIYMVKQRFSQNMGDSRIVDRESYYQMLDKKGYTWVNLQSPRQKTKQQCDVFIPLNLMYDAAALGVESCFCDIRQWLEETLDFVIHRMKCSVLIREHPCARFEPSFFKSTDIADIYPELLKPYENKELFHYVRSDEDINSYQYMERCKIILPWTSTIGVEAALMKKNVIIHTNAFYANSNFVIKAYTKDEYFSFIEKCLSSEEWLVVDEALAYKEALKYFYLGMNRDLRTKFTVYDEDYACITHTWLGESFHELLQEDGIDEITQIVAENVPSVYLIAKQRLENRQ